MAHEPDPGPDFDLDPESRVAQASDVLLAALRPVVLEAGGILDLASFERAADDLFEPLPPEDRPTGVLTEAVRGGRRALVLLPALQGEATESGPVHKRVADVETLTERLALTHRVTDAERSSGRLDLCSDLAALVYAAEIHGGLHSPDGHPLQLRERQTEGRGRAGGELHTVHLEGADGWLESYCPGQLVRARTVAGILTFEVVSDEALASPPKGYAAVLEQVVDACNEDDGFPVDAAEIQLALAADRPEWFASPLRPFGDLVAEAGLESDGMSVGRPGSWESWRDLGETVRQLMTHQLPEELSNELPKLVEAFRSWRAGDRPSRSLAAQLHRDWLLLWPLEQELRLLGASPEEIERFAEAVGQQAGPQPRAVAHWMAARAAALAGEPTRAEELVDEALAADPAFPPAHEEAAGYASDRSRTREAVNHLHRIRPDDDVELVRLRELARLASPKVGRNDRCPCGSGRKFKQCHLGRWEVPECDRVRWLLEKARQHTLRAASPELVHSMARVGGSRPEAQAIGLDLLMFDEEWFGQFLDARGPLLSEWERATGWSWMAGHNSSVFRVDAVGSDGGRRLTDSTTGRSYDVVYSPALDQAGRDRVVWCRLVPVETRWYATGIVLVTRLTERARLLAALAKPAHPEDQLEALLEVPEDIAFDAAGRASVECWSSFSVAGSGEQDPVAGLDRVLQRHTSPSGSAGSGLIERVLGDQSRFPVGIYQRSGPRDADGEPVESDAEMCEWRLTCEPRGLEPSVVGRVKRVGRNRWEAQAETVGHYEELTRALVEAVGATTVHEERRVPFARARALLWLEKQAGALSEELGEMAEGREREGLGPEPASGEGVRAHYPGPSGERRTDREELDGQATPGAQRAQLEAETERLQAELDELEAENARLLKATEEIRALWADTPARGLGKRTPREAAADDELRPDVLTMIAELHPDDEDQADTLRSVLGLT